MSFYVSRSINQKIKPILLLLINGVKLFELSVITIGMWKYKLLLKWPQNRWGGAIKILLQMKLPLLELDVFPIYFFEFERIVVMSKLTCYGIHFNKIDFLFCLPFKYLVHIIWMECKRHFHYKILIICLWIII